MANTFLSWIYPTRFEKTPIWYAIAIILVLTLVIYGIVMKIWIMSIVALLFAGVYMLHENNTPPTLRVEIRDDGIDFGNGFYEYAKIDRFAILYIGDIPRILRLHVNKVIPPIRDIPITHDVNVVELRTYLSTQIAEDAGEKFTTTDYLIQMMRL